MPAAIASAYWAGLQEQLRARGHTAALSELGQAHGASEGDIARLRAAYPLAPETLLDLLRLIDGTYFRDYGGQTVCGYVLGSDVFEYPYYLLSAAEMVDAATNDWADKSLRDIYGDALDEWLPVTPSPKPGDGNRDSRIDPDLLRGRWLHFSDCMNNGGTSQLFIDFNPLAGGVVGQVVRNLHDPDSYEVIADSFGAYLQGLMDDGYAFAGRDEDEDAS